MSNLSVEVKLNLNSQSEHRSEKTYSFSTKSQTLSSSCDLSRLGIILHKIQDTVNDNLTDVVNEEKNKGKENLQQCSIRGSEDEGKMSMV